MENNKIRRIKNNNPLKIRHKGNEWIGMSKSNKSNGFVTFKTLEYGFRAAWRMLYGCYVHLRVSGRAFTYRNMLERLGMFLDKEDVKAYTNEVIARMGVTGDELLLAPKSPEGREKLAPLLVVITQTESGLELNSEEIQALSKGHSLAFKTK